MSAEAAAAYRAANASLTQITYLTPLLGKDGLPNNFENSGSMPQLNYGYPLPPN
jgi:hypothetical protein